MLSFENLKKIYTVTDNDQATIAHTERLIRDVRYYRQATGEDNEQAQNRLRAWMIKLTPRQIAITRQHQLAHFLLMGLNGHSLSLRVDGAVGSPPAPWTMRGKRSGWRICCHTRERKRGLPRASVAPRALGSPSSSPKGVGPAP